MNLPFENISHNYDESYIEISDEIHNLSFRQCIKELPLLFESKIAFQRKYITENLSISNDPTKSTYFLNIIEEKPPENVDFVKNEYYVLFGVNTNISYFTDFFWLKFFDIYIRSMNPDNEDKNSAKIVFFDIIAMLMILGNWNIEHFFERIQEDPFYVVEIIKKITRIHMIRDKTFIIVKNNLFDAFTHYMSGIIFSSRILEICHKALPFLCKKNKKKEKEYFLLIDQQMPAQINEIYESVELIKKITGLSCKYFNYSEHSILHIHSHISEVYDKNVYENIDDVILYIEQNIHLIPYLPPNINSWKTTMTWIIYSN